MKQNAHITDYEDSQLCALLKDFIWSFPHEMRQDRLKLLGFALCFLVIDISITRVIENVCCVTLQTIDVIIRRILK